MKLCIFVPPPHIRLGTKPNFLTFQVTLNAHLKSQKVFKVFKTLSNAFSLENILEIVKALTQ